jgi:hypothetical protein
VTQVRRYSIEIKDVETGIVVVSTVVDWTPDERRLAVRLAMREADEPDHLRVGETGPA